MSLDEVRQQVNELIDSEDMLERGIITSQALFNIYQILTDRDRFDGTLLNTIHNNLTILTTLDNRNAERMIRGIELELRTVAA